MPGTPAAQCDYDVATVAMNTGTGTQAISLNCGGKTPKGGVLIATRATALGTPVNGAMISIAVWDAAGTTRLISYMAEHGAAIASADSGRRQSNAVILQELDTGSEAITGEAIFSSVAADTLTIDITDAPVAAIMLEVWAFYGDTMQCHVDAVQASGTEDVEVTETGIPFSPRALIAIGGVGGFATSGANARPSMGFCAFNDDMTVQGQLGACSFDREASTIVSADGGGFRTDSILQRILVSVLGVLTEEARFEITGATADGFKVTTRAGSNNTIIGYLAIYTGKLRAWVGTPSLGLASTGDKPITSTGPGFRPRFLACLASRQTTNNAYVDDQQALHFGVGAAVDGSEASACFHCLDNVSPNSATASSSDAALATVVTFAGGGGLVVDWSITLVSFDSQPAGFTVNVGTASGLDRLVGFLAFEDGSYPQWWDALVPGRPRAARRLARM